MRSAQHTAIAHQTMVMRLLQAVAALSDLIHIRAVGRRGFASVSTEDHALLVVCHLPEASHSDVLQFAVLATMRDHFVGVRANEAALQTVKM